MLGRYPKRTGSVFVLILSAYSLEGSVAVLGTWLVIFVLAGAFLLQTVLSYFQTRYYTREFVRLRKMGRVVIGRKRGIISAGTLVLFAINAEGVILTASRIQGVTVFARGRQLKRYDGKSIASLTVEDCKTENKLLQKAILNAVSNYNTIMSGGQIPPSPSFFQKIGLFFKQRVAKSKA